MENKKQMLLVLGMMIFLANGDSNATATLLAEIAKDLNLDVSTAALSVTAYMMSFGVFTLLFGPLSDRFGKAKIINIAALGTAIFSVLGSTAFNLPSLIIFRALNGIFGAGVFPVTLALVGESFDHENRQKAIAKIMGMAFLGGASATVIGGAIAYVGSWRMVYLLYGIGELTLAVMMLKLLKRDKPVTDKFRLFASYKTAMTNFRFMRLVMLLFFAGFSVIGSFTYAGVLFLESTEASVLVVGLILSLFGIGTVTGSRIAPKIRMKMDQWFLVFAGSLGAISLFALSVKGNIFIMALGLFGFGIAFVFMQSTLVATAQEKLSGMKGTAMSLVSFHMVVGGATGAAVNGVIMETYGTEQIFFNASFIIFAVGVLAAIFVSRFEMRKRQEAYS